MRFRIQHMKFSSPALSCILLLTVAISTFAWTGFDADSIDLVEIEADVIPSKGETIDIKDHDTGITKTGIVQSLKQNKSTIEVVVLYPDNTLHTLVMEGR